MASTATKGRILRQTVVQWSLGMYVSIPLIAVIQGSYHLSEYRTQHGNAPRPVMPARGVAVAVERGFLPKFLNNEKPLRLLVVGDSLAAGVGMSKSGSPILPESIARALSKACGGRAVYWTCVGTPGVSASQIVQDIHKLEPHQPGRLDQLFLEWKAKRRKFQERRKLRRRLTELESTDDEELPIKDRNYIKDWWESLRSGPDRSLERVRKATSQMIQEWWTQVTGRFRATRERVKEDLTDIKEIVQSPQGEEDKDGEKLIREGHVFKRDSLDPEVVAQYDIAVVLTGLNDLKDAFLPHMTSGAKSSLQDGTSRIVGGLRNQLRGIVDALEERMDTHHAKNEAEESKERARPNDTLENLRRPLVVVPELPIAPLRLFRLVPLCWFLNPLFWAMENNKRFLSSCFPDHVVFIPQPDLKWWADAEAGFGPIREHIRRERLLLRTTDIAQNARERIQELMRQHYYPDGDDDEAEGVLDDTHGPEGRHKDEHHPHHPHHHSDHHVVPTDKSKSSQIGSGSHYVAMDNMHPNDEGYDLWGRHIAAAILEHWNR